MEQIPGSTRNSLAYEMEPFEVGILILGFKREISREKKQMEKWENHPKNEGQVTYLEKIRKCFNYIKYLEKQVKILTKDRDLYLAAQTGDPEKLTEAIKKHS